MINGIVMVVITVGPRTFDTRSEWRDEASRFLTAHAQTLTPPPQIAEFLSPSRPHHPKNLGINIAQKPYIVWSLGPTALIYESLDPLGKLT